MKPIDAQTLADLVLRGASVLVRDDGHAVIVKLPGEPEFTLIRAPYETKPELLARAVRLAARDLRGAA